MQITNTDRSSRRRSDKDSVSLPSFRRVQPVVNSSRRTGGYTAYGFPSTLMQGRRVTVKGDPDPFVENETYVDTSNCIQNAVIKTKQIAGQQANKNKDPLAIKTDYSEENPSNQLDRMYEGFHQRNKKIKDVRL